MATNQPAPDAGSITERFAAYICGERIDKIDNAAIQRTKQILTYHIGLALRAINASEQDSLQAVAIARELSEDCGSSTLIGHRGKTTLVDAAFANCTMMRAQGLDDVIFPAGIHAG